MTATLPTSLPTTTETPLTEIPLIASAAAEAAIGTTAAPVETVTREAKPRWISGQVFWSTFVTIFLAELGDKTQLTTLLMTAESHSPWVVFGGAATALITTSLLGVLVGQWLAQRLSPKVLNTAAGIMLLLVSALLVLDLWQ